MFQRFRSNTKQTPQVESKAAYRPAMFAVHGTGRAVWSARDTHSLGKNGFAGNPVGYRCITMIAEAVGDIPLKLNSDGIYQTHPMLDLLRQPNTIQSFSELWSALVVQFMLTGNAYLEAVQKSDNSLGALYLLRSDRMRVIPGVDGWPVAYEYTVSGRKRRFDMNGGASAVLHIKNTNPYDDHYGISPLQAAANALDVHSAAARWSKALLDNAARPSGAIVYRGADGQSNLRTEQYNRLVDELENNHQGARNAGRPMLLEGGLDWKQMGFSPSDMEFQKTKDSAAREIALALGVPPLLLGLPGDNTHANYQEANRAFYRQTVLPLCHKIAAAVGNWFALHSNEAMQLYPDLDQIPALASERDAQWQRIAMVDFLSDGEKRALLGLE